MGNDDTGWKAPEGVVGNDDYARGKINLDKAVEAKPCMMCRFWEKPELTRMIQHLAAHGLTQRPDGKFVTPIAKDIPGRRSLVLDPVDQGFCRKDTMVTDAQATCPAWQQVRTASEMADRIR